jgi:hypothetical protein
VPRALWENLNGTEECWLYPYLPSCSGGGDEPTPAMPGDPASP